MLTFALAALLCAAPPQGDVRYPARPAAREFILDDAKLLTDAAREEIRTLCDETLTKKKAPIIVVTIPSLASMGAGSWPIERYAMNLMGEWGVGHEDWNYGMLLLVSPGDRKARIELGGSWERRKDDQCKRVMSDRIIPRFKQGDYAGGIVEGVKGLRAIALELGAPTGSGVTTRPSTAPTNVPTNAPNVPISLPRSGFTDTPSPLSGFGSGACSLFSLPLLLFAVVAIFAIVRGVGRGASSWGGGGPGWYGPQGGGYGGGYGGGFGRGFGGGLVGGALGGMLYDTFAHRGGHSSGGGGFFGGGGGGGSSSSPSSSSSGDSSFGGGSFGGGFSGGGGATGSW